MILPDSTLELTHYYIKNTLQPGDIAIDATAGNGNDTLFMANIVGETGKVYAFDIQPQAIENTKKLLEKNDVSERVQVICDGHQNMKNYVAETGKVKAVMFNLGYLPGGDHSVTTKTDTSSAAIAAALDLLDDEGIITIGIYYGKDTGFDEKNGVTEFLKSLDSKKYNILMHDYINRPNCPPLAAVLQKKTGDR